MSFSSWLRSLKFSRTRTSARRSRRYTSRLGVERLEDRTVPSRFVGVEGTATASRTYQSDGLLTGLNGTASASSQLDLNTGVLPDPFVPSTGGTVTMGNVVGGGYVGGLVYSGSEARLFTQSEVSFYPEPDFTWSAHGECTAQASVQLRVEATSGETVGDS